MALGYPAYKLTSRKLMRDKDRMVHYDRSKPEDFRTEAEVDDFIKKARTWTTANHRRGVDKKMMGWVEGFEPSISRATTWRLNHWATLTVDYLIIA